MDEADVVNGPWIRRSRRVAYENDWITIWHDEVTRPDGAPGVYGVVHFANLAAGVIAIDDRDRVLLVGQHRYALDAYSWEIPEGGVPDGEMALDGARRELLEETGVVAAEWRELARVHLSRCRTVAVFWRPLTSGVARPDGTGTSAADPVRRGHKDDLDGRITDAMTVIAVGVSPSGRSPRCELSASPFNTSTRTGRSAVPDVPRQNGGLLRYAVATIRVSGPPLHPFPRLGSRCLQSGDLGLDDVLDVPGPLPALSRCGGRTRARHGCQSRSIVAGLVHSRNRRTTSWSPRRWSMRNVASAGNASRVRLAGSNPCRRRTHSTTDSSVGNNRWSFQAPAALGRRHQAIAP
jgi:hypothetical protein